MQNQPDQAQSHNYIWAMIELLQKRAHELKPGLIYFHVAHDRECGIFKNEFCNCDPEVIMRTPAAECIDFKSNKSRDNFLKLIRKGA